MSSRWIAMAHMEGHELRRGRRAINKHSKENEWLHGCTIQAKPDLDDHTSTERRNRASCLEVDLGAPPSPLPSGVPAALPATHALRLATVTAVVATLICVLLISGATIQARSFGSGRMHSGLLQMNLWNERMSPSLCATQAVKLPDCMPEIHHSKGHTLNSPYKVHGKPVPWKTGMRTYPSMSWLTLELARGSHISSTSCTPA